MDSKMAIYGVTVTESFAETYYVIAPSKEVAHEMVRDAYFNDELTINGFDEVETEAFELPSEMSFEQLPIDFVYEERVTSHE